MSTRVDTALLGDLKRFGAFDVSQCFHCGNCTAVCPLSNGSDNFPRRMIRYSQIGDRQRLLASKEAWLCYYCGECSETCPRQAEPGEFMAAVRRYAIASFDPTGISRLLYTSKLYTAVLMFVLSLLFALLMLNRGGAMEFDHPAIFQFIPFEIIHHVGFGVIAVAVLAMVAGIVRMTRMLSRGIWRPSAGEGSAVDGSLVRKVSSAGRATIAELAAERRYRDCEAESATPWYRSRWFMHGAIMWGFIGLAAATAIDYLLLLIVDKVPGQPEPLWHPTRLLGTVAGMVALYGVTFALISRFRKPDKYSSHSLLSDWLFLWLLFGATFTGFLVEIALYLPRGTTWGYIAFLVHVVLGMEIVVLLPFTKFAHAVYRPLALFALRMGSSETGQR